MTTSLTSLPLINLSNKRVYLACGKTDMRKQINGLSEIVASKFELDLFDDAQHFCFAKAALRASALLGGVSCLCFAMATAIA